MKWVEYQRKNRMWFIKVDGSFEEYRGQMVALHEVIVGKTGLKVCDLR